MSDNSKIDHELLVRAVARELADNPVRAFYNDEKSGKDINLTVDKIMLGSFVSIYQKKLHDKDLPDAQA